MTGGEWIYSNAIPPPFWIVSWELGQFILILYYNFYFQRKEGNPTECGWMPYITSFFQPWKVSPTTTQPSTCKTQMKSGKANPFGLKIFAAPMPYFLRPLLGQPMSRSAIRQVPLTGRVAKRLVGWLTYLRYQSVWLWRKDALIFDVLSLIALFSCHGLAN